MSGEWIFETGQRRTFLDESGFPAESRAFLHEAAGRIGGDPDLKRSFLEEVPLYLSGNLKGSARAEDWGWGALLVLAGFPEMQAAHAKKGIDHKISQATASDLARWISDHLAGRTFRPGLPLSWFRNHLHHGLLEIGRLQFLPRPFEGQVRVYARSDATSIALAGSGIACTPSGWPDPEGAGFVTVFEESPSSVIGHPADPISGRYLDTPLRLELPDWTVRLAPGDPVLDVHVPSGEPLHPEACQRSFAAAAEVFGRCLPETPWRAFTCTSWLLDRELRHCLPPGSGILGFGECFHPFPPKTTNSQEFVERVFANTADWRTFPARTSLQIAAQAHLLAGGTFRTTSGYVLREQTLSPT